MRSTDRDFVLPRIVVKASEGEGRLPWLTDALDNLRDLARGIYPPLLADQGLPAGLASSPFRRIPRSVRGSARTTQDA